MFMGKGNAQYWELNGNNLPGSYSPPFIVGAINNTAPYDIYFYANGNQYMDLQYNTGFFGIGNGFAPSYRLDVNATTNTNGNIFRTIGNGSFDCDWEAWTGSGTGGPALVVRLFVPASTSNFVMEASHGALQFNTDSAKRMTITRKGNVVVYTSVILKASDGDNYYKLTVNNNGELKITQVNNQTL